MEGLADRLAKNCTLAKTTGGSKKQWPQTKVFSSSVFPNSLQVQVPSPLCATNAPPLPLVSCSKATQCAAAYWSVQAAATLRLTAVLSVSSGFELGNPVRLERGLLSIGRVRDGLQT